VSIDIEHRSAGSVPALHADSGVSSASLNRLFSKAARECRSEGGGDDEQEEDEEEEEEEVRRKWM
jgi:hypothetical protein